MSSAPSARGGATLEMGEQLKVSQLRKQKRGGLEKLFPV